MYRPKSVNETALKYYQKIEDYKLKLAILEQELLEAHTERDLVCDEIADLEVRLQVICAVSKTTLNDLYSVVHYNEEQ
jgi:hypothetical protein